MWSTGVLPPGERPQLWPFLEFKQYVCDSIMERNWGNLRDDHQISTSQHSNKDKVKFYDPRTLEDLIIQRMQIFHLQKKTFKGVKNIKFSYMEYKSFEDMPFHSLYSLKMHNQP